MPLVVTRDRTRGVHLIEACLHQGNENAAADTFEKRSGSVRFQLLYPAERVTNYEIEDYLKTFKP